MHKGWLKGVSLAIAVMTAFAFARGAAAVQIAPNPNPAGSTVEVGGNFNATSYTNEGVLNVGSNLFGPADFTNQASGAILNQNGGKIDSRLFGTVTNHGAITVDGPTSSFLNHNGGLVTNTDPGSSLTVQNGGTVQNYETDLSSFNRQTSFTNQNGAAITVTDFGSTLMNGSALPNEGGSLFTNTDSGTTLTNKNGGSVINTAVGSNFLNQNGATFTNDNASLFNQDGATFTNTDAGTRLVFQNGGILYNQPSEFGNNAAPTLVNRNGAALVIDGSSLRNGGGDAANGNGIMTNTDASTTLTIQNSGSFENQNSGTVFTNDNGASFTTTDSGTTLLNGNGARIVNQNGATFTNQNTAAVTNVGSSLVNQTGGTLTNTDFGSQLTNLAGATLINDGAGTNLFNQNAATITNDASTITNRNGASFTNGDGLSDTRIFNQNGGMITNTGSGTTLTNNVFGSIQNSGGTINNQNGATLINWGAINGGTINNSATFINNGGLGGNGIFNLTGGLLVNNGAIQFSGSGGQFNMTGGILMGTGFIDPPAAIVIGAGGTVQPGDHGIGKLTFGGDVNFDGELDIEIASLLNFDILDVTGDIHFGPDALIKLFFEGFAPTLGNTFDFLQALNFDGAPRLEFTGLGRGFGFNLIGDGSGGLEVATALTPGTQSVPEPAAFWVLVAGLAGLAFTRAREGLLIRRAWRRTPESAAAPVRSQAC